MTFDILDKMVDLTVMNAVDGSIIGISKRLIFSKKRLNFKYVLVEGNDEDNSLLYLQYPDILRVNDRGILCLLDERSSVNNYIYFNDPDAFVFVGNEAVDEAGKAIGHIASAQLDEAANILTFTVQQGMRKCVFDIDRLVEITQSGVIIVHRTAEDIFLSDEEKMRLENPVEEEIEVAPVTTEDTPEDHFTIEETPVEETLVEETSVEETSVEETLTEAAQMTEATMPEITADEIIVDEAVSGSYQTEGFQTDEFQMEGVQVESAQASVLTEEQNDDNEPTFEVPEASVAIETEPQPAAPELVLTKPEVEPEDRLPRVDPVGSIVEEKTAQKSGMDIQWGQRDNYSSSDSSLSNDFDTKGKKSKKKASKNKSEKSATGGLFRFVL